MPESRTVHAVDHTEKSASRHLPLVNLLIDTRAELTELVVRSGMKVLEAMLEEDRVAVCGPRYAHQAERAAGRAGTTTSAVLLGGRRKSPITSAIAASPYSRRSSPRAAATSPSS